MGFEHRPAVDRVTFEGVWGSQCGVVLGNLRGQLMFLGRSADGQVRFQVVNTWSRPRRDTGER